MSSSENSSSTNTFDDDGDKSTGRSRVDVGGKEKNKSGVVINKKGIATAESRQVNRLRLFVLFVLVFAGINVCLTVYFLMKEGQSTQFENQFNGQAGQITLAFQQIASEKFGSLGALRVAAIAEAVTNNITWPLYYMSSFEKRAAVARRLSETICVAMNPFITDTDRSSYERYTAKAGPDWIGDSLQFQSKVGITIFGNASYLPFSVNETSWPIFASFDINPPPPEPGPGPYLPFWQSSPLITSLLNFDYFALDVSYDNGVNAPLLAIQSNKAVTSGFKNVSAGGLDSYPQGAASFYAGFLSTKAGNEVEYEGDPLSDLYLPIAKSFDDNTTVAVLFSIVQWGSYFDDLLPVNAENITVVIDDSCTEPRTFIVKGADVIYIGKGDLHETRFNSNMVSATWATIDKIEDGTENGLPYLSSHCPPSIQVYPTTVYEDSFNNHEAVYMTITVAMVFVFTILVFVAYDRLVEKRQKIVLTKALQSTAIVSSLFPENVADRLMQQQQQATDDEQSHNKNSRKKSSQNMIRSFVLNHNDNQGNFDEPIADLFPNATVFFADIAGFTAWSSSREPAQVFILLQNIYQAFDQIANRRKVFKVETIGDSYVAVTGCPEIQEQHAVIMARFATDCQRVMIEVTSRLCITLGPDTNDLAMRIGMHSGPVTAGVLQGERARFQLFGDTVNTASRMESTGIKNKIQVSESTAQCLIDARKGHWLSPREDQINAKGKGLLVTYWLNTNTKASTINSSLTGSSSDNGVRNSQVVGLSESVVPTSELPQKDDNHDLLIDWVCELLQGHIKQLVARRKHGSTLPSDASKKLVFAIDYSKIPLDEVVEAITLPEYTEISNSNQEQSIKPLDPMVMTQLRQYISSIVATYRKNAFHNFQHACHVAMSSNKLLMRVVNPTLEHVDSSNTTPDDLDHRIYDYTYGINSDPITMLAIILSAIIHDVDHRGVSNTRLIIEQEAMANQYRNKSIAEQNSFDVAWSLLVSDEFVALRDCLFTTQCEVDRFRQVLINSVLATDIFDKELNDLRKQRWVKAFADKTTSIDGNGNDDRYISNLRATIIIEHIMQASDVAHTMQHWQIYRKWNRLLFHEMYAAYQAGRMGTNNPGDFWYEGELSFFDGYIIPLARKLKECGVFGVYSDEYLNYAEKNRAEWQARGREVVVEMMEELDATMNQDHSHRSVFSL